MKLLTPFIENLELFAAAVVTWSCGIKETQDASQEKKRRRLIELLVSDVIWFFSFAPVNYSPASEKKNYFQPTIIASSFSNTNRNQFEIIIYQPSSLSAGIIPDTVTSVTV